MSEPKIRVAVVFGGRSTEHAISCVSAASVLANVDTERFDVLPVGITPEGAWVLAPGASTLAIEGGALPSVTAGTEVVLSGPRFVELREAGASGVLDDVDVVIPMLHGAYGEDGTIQGLLEMSGIPYVGSGVLASAVSMDKAFTKRILAAEGLPVGEYELLTRNDRTLSQEQRDRLGLPVFVKPCRAGSSHGISKVTDWAELDDAIAFARSVDPKVLVEAAVAGREVECGVLEFPDGRVEASLPAEVQTDSDWYDFEAKYLDESLELHIPAKLDDAVLEKVRALAVHAFKAVDGEGLARVDFFVTDDGDVLVNELNTMPGCTPSSAYPKMWAVTGIDFKTLVSTLIDTALARGSGLR
ncbi:D-alanine--D-alanine ligase family protein [Kibdelosporangium phytohabitans]|uniref:D-alanine--D-alanine ligase n=1 Tax=Kibdelosporangium phytohabitans TaxID=860235 RepID=A0A0N9I509_9PSEU|nr:D-alanine--D-alanine ligase family protein [Kibdelosporangium phytohabitans]ALG13107.1 D-alanine--D-alanine ligase [Kibdelosporangium phytohabitans]MBE1464848.1 D-alanine-D-alanine ligase [Kibdelosporangium phytohabitans]